LSVFCPKDKRFYPLTSKTHGRNMSSDDEVEKIIRLRKVTQEASARKEVLHKIWVRMQNFAQGLRNELDGQYWSENKIAFDDLGPVPEFNQYRFTYSELEGLFDVAYIKEVLDTYRRLLEEKAQLEAELGISMDRRAAA
jgi:hypothetical protein